jgi:ferric-dicitrate binding protein FerR (iron transport regulator)
VLTELAAVRAEVGAQAAPPARPTRRRVTTGLSVLAALAGLAVTAIVVWVGHAGSVVVWQGIGQ